MDRRGAQLSERSKRVLAEGRRIASHLGATLYAVAAENDDDNDVWIGEAGLTGADKVVLLSFGSAGDPPASTEPPLDVGLLAAAVMAVCDALSPNLVLLDNDRLGLAMAPALASHLAAQLFLGARPSYQDSEDVLLEQRSADRRSRRSIRIAHSESTIVASLSSAGVQTTHGQDDADVIFFKAPRFPVTLPADVKLTEPHTAPDPRLDAQIVVCAGLGALNILEDVRKLAQVLDAPVVFTKSLGDHFARVNPDQVRPVVDRAAHHIAPTLYLICGEDNSDEHLSALALGTQIVSLGVEPCCSTVAASRYACLGPLAATVRDFTQAAKSPPTPQSVPSIPSSIGPLRAAANPNAFSPCPDAVELFSDPRELLARLQQDGLWTP